MRWQRHHSRTLFKIEKITPQKHLPLDWSPVVCIAAIVAMFFRSRSELGWYYSGVLCYLLSLKIDHVSRCTTHGEFFAMRTGQASEKTDIQASFVIFGNYLHAI